MPANAFKTLFLLLTLVATCTQCLLNEKKVSIYNSSILGLRTNGSSELLLSTHSHDPCWWGESDVPACGPPASFSVHLAISAVTPAGSVHKSRGDNVVRMWVQLKR